MKNIMITGGCGFIGSNLIKWLMGKYSEYNIFNVDKLTYCANTDNVKEICQLENYKFFQLDIGSEEIGEIFKEYHIDTVINLAASTHVDRSIRHPKEFLETDVMGVFNLALTIMKSRVTKFVHISTDEVYGSMAQSNYEASEVTPLCPTSPYAASKAAGDLLLLSYYKTYNLPVTIVRPCNNYGPNQYPEKLVPMSITRLLNNKKVLLHGDGAEKREWLYVKDCCKAIDCILHNGKEGSIYNVGSGLRLSNYQIVTAIIDRVFHDNKVEEHIERIENRPGNDKLYAINSNRMKKLFGGTYADTPFDFGLMTTVRWYENNPAFWSNVDLDANIYVSNDQYLR
jgi:dTDP-glucose 4,6-dehydratase